MQRAYSYVRFSKSIQGQGDSLRRQIQGTRTYCDKLGLTLDESLELKDLGVSGYTGKNLEKGALGVFISACEQGIVPRGSALIIEAFDRLSRQAPRKSIGLLLRLLDDYGIEVHLTNIGKVFRPDSKDEGMDLIIATSMAIEANSFSAKNSERLREAWAELRRRAKDEGHVMRADLPWWLIIENDKIVSPPERAAVVKEIYEMTASGLSSLQIARKLNALKRPTWRSQTQWNSSRVRDVVRVRRAEGILTGTAKTVAAGRDYEIPGYYPAVVTPELAAQARAVMVRNTRGARGRHGEGKRPINLFRGILRYRSKWLRHGTHQNGKPDPETGEKGFNGYYECIDELATKKRQRVLYSVPARQLELILATALIELTPEDLAPRKVERPETVKLAQLRGELAVLIQKEKNLLAAVESGSTGVAARLAEVEIERRRKEREVARAELLTTKPIKQNTKDLVPLSKQLSDTAARELAAAAIRRLITRIDVGDDLADLFLSATVRMKFIKEISKTKPIPDPTARRMRRSIWILVHFASGAHRLIARPVDEDGDSPLRKAVRVIEKGAEPEKKNPRVGPPTWIFSARVEPG